MSEAPAAVRSQLATRNSQLFEYDVEAVREDFPILSRTVHERKLVYLDNAATSHKPRAVVEAVRRVYEEENGNIHRGVHWLSQRATEVHDAARERVRRYINARHAHEVIFTRGTTESINLVAASFGQGFVTAGDEIVATALEHHSNLVPWQMLAARTGARIRVAPVDDTGTLDVEALEALLNERTKLVAVVHLSNALGTINPVQRIVESAHARGIPVLVDGAQSVAHLPVDVQALDCDFLAFSGHKALGPTGIGVLYGREEWLDRMPPWQGGGDMIETVEWERSTWAPLPNKFEAGTPNMAGAAGLAAALDYLEALGPERVHAHEDALLAYATERVQEVPGLTLVGTAAHKASVLSFVLDGVHPHDIGTILDAEGIAIRAGHHCAQPLMRRLGVPATARASFACYSTAAEVDALVAGLHRVREVFG